jgi:hypothetical protein
MTMRVCSGCGIAYPVVELNNYLQCQDCCPRPQKKETLAPNNAVDKQHEEVQRQNRRAQRLGIYSDIEGIDSQYLPTFARIIRLAGILIVGLALWWGNWYEWSYSSSPFEALADSLEIRNEEFAAFIMSAAIGVVGYYQRFRVGLFVGGGLVRLTSKLVRKIINSI